MEDCRQELMRKIKALNETIWEGRTPGILIDEWLRNFREDLPGQPSERLHALYLLSQFMYFGAREMRELLRAAYRDLYRYPLIQRIRRGSNNTTDVALILAEFGKHLSATRFLGMGNPSESGCHILYYFRQENRLPKDLFIHTHQMTRRVGSPLRTTVRFADVSHYVFLDDFCGSGTQARDYSEDVLEEFKEVSPNSKISYFTLFATEAGLDCVRNGTRFDEVKTIYTLDASYRAFDAQSRFFHSCPSGVSKPFAESMARIHGEQLLPDHPLGFADGQALIGFHHNTPDNTLPIIWFDEPDSRPWKPIFRRYPKEYGLVSHGT